MSALEVQGALGEEKRQKTSCQMGRHRIHVPCSLSPASPSQVSNTPRQHFSEAELEG